VANLSPDSLKPVDSKQSDDEPVIKAVLPETQHWVLLALARGMAFFLGVYAGLSLLAVLISQTYNANSWWIDLGPLPHWLTAPLEAGLAVGLVSFSLRPSRHWLWRFVLISLLLIFAVAALVNSLTVWSLARAGRIHLGFPLPFSFLVMLIIVFLLIVIAFVRLPEPDQPPRKWFVKTTATAALATLSCGLGFPVGQVVCFGLTDYRAPVDAAVVLGAKVYPSGHLSRSLRDRVDAAILLYQQGLAPVLIMSGGTGWEGVNEAEAMKQYAIEKGVPEEAILIDRYGNNTALTVEHTIALAEQNGYQKIAAVSTFYHLARIKMLYLQQGTNVSTVPARLRLDTIDTFRGALREIPAWWFYWFQTIFNY